MQIKVLHKNIYTLNQYALSQQSLEIYRAKYEKPVRDWKKLKDIGANDKECQEIIGISRATYYRYDHHLKNLKKGIFPPKRKSIKPRGNTWKEEEIKLVLEVRRNNPTK